MSLFPYKLHQLLTDIGENVHLSSIISWLPSGNGFQLNEPELFEDLLLTKYFPRQTQLKSFKRQLQYYGFDNLGDGIFAHPHFIRGQRHLCGRIIHQLPTKSQKAGNHKMQLNKARGKRAKRTLRDAILSGPQTLRSIPMLGVHQVIPRITSKVSIPSPFVPPPLASHMPLMQAPIQNTLKQVLQGGHRSMDYWDSLKKKEADQKHRNCSLEKGGLCARQTTALINASKATRLPPAYVKGKASLTPVQSSSAPLLHPYNQAVINQVNFRPPVPPSA
jgi:hypothetical protein